MKGFEIIQPNDVRDGLKKHRDTYNDKGKYLGWDLVDQYYTMQLGTCTDWTGFPRSGKTQVLMEMLLNTSKYYSWRHLVYFPDVGNKFEIIADLIHKLTGKTFNPKYPNTISDEEIDKELDWLLHHFKILTKKDVKAKLSPFQFWDLAVKVKQEHGLETASIDSWKDMFHDYHKYGGYATYLEEVLPYRNMIAEENNLHLHTIIHPKLVEKENGVRPAPTPFSLKGGSEWFNSGKCMVTVHREDVQSIEADIHFHKMKPRSCGTVGSVKMLFDIQKLVYYTENETGGRVYASPKGDLPKPNHDPVSAWRTPEKEDFDNDLPF